MLNHKHKSYTHALCNLRTKVFVMKPVLRRVRAYPNISAENPDIAPALAMLTVFSNHTEERGKVIDTFDLKFTPEAKIMLNGKDITAMVMPRTSPPQ